MDRYAIALGKKAEPQRGFWAPNEHAWNFPDRLRLVVVGVRSSGKTSYLIKDAIETSRAGKCLFVCPYGSANHIAHMSNLLNRYKSHLDPTCFDVCTWEQFSKKIHGRGFRSIYFDEGDGYDMTIAAPQSSSYGILSNGDPLFQLMSFAQNRLANIPRVIITAYPSSIVTTGNPIPRGNWDWKIEEIKKKEELCF